VLADDVPTPAIVIDAAVVRRNLGRMADYAKARNLSLRPHTKTHKSKLLAEMQVGLGAAGLAVAKVGEARVMAEVADDVLMAYPAVDARRCTALAELGRTRTVRVAIDSAPAADALAGAARAAGSTIGILVELDVGMHRTGVPTPAAALALAQHVSRHPGLRLDGLMFFPGHVWERPAEQGVPLGAVDALVGEALDLWRASGLEARIVSGGSTPTAYQSHLVTRQTELRPGTYIFNDMNCVTGDFGVTLDDCAARVTCTVVSTAVAGQVVVDAGSKVLTSDRCHPAPDSGHGHVVGLPAARVARLSEEHGMVDVSRCDRVPRIGERLAIVPNHICPCINLQDRVYWNEGGEVRALEVDARGRVF
jgi:D-serine deaminase-like pyridoxal phosphate-dependent protein